MKILTKLFSNTVLSALTIALLGSLGNFAYQWYLQPRLILDSSYEFSKIGEQVVGSIQIANLGRSSSETITVRINVPLNKENDAKLTVNGITEELEVKLNPDFTDLVIKKLDKDDQALLSFIPEIEESTYFDVAHWSKSGRIEKLEWKKEWWEFEKVQIGFILVVVVASILAGYLLRKKNHR